MDNTARRVLSHASRDQRAAESQTDSIIYRRLHRDGPTQIKD